MIWFLLITVVNGTPSPAYYATEAEACVAYAATPGSHVYQVQDGRKVTIAEGDCVPAVHFKSK